MTVPWLIAVDLDGTLLDADKRISARTQAAMSSVCDAGHHVIAVTGRTRYSAASLLAGLPAIDCIIGSNGAYAHRVATGSLDWSHPILATQAERWIGLIRDRLPDASVGWESRDGIVYEPAFLALAGDPNSIDPGATGSRPLAGDLHKLFVRSPTVGGRELQRLVADLLLDTAEVSASGVPFIEVTAAGVDKGAALRQVARALDVPLERTIVFGDNFNDVPMFCVAGIAVAMGNAVAEVRALADHVAPSNTADGVGVMLEQLLMDGMG